MKVLIALFCITFLAGCTCGPIEPPPEPPMFPEGYVLSIAELLKTPTSAELEIYGEVSGLGELRCPCFNLTSENESIIVFYQNLSNESVQINELRNGNIIVVSGELVMSTLAESENQFQAKTITKPENAANADFRSDEECNEKCRANKEGACRTPIEIDSSFEKMGNCIIPGTKCNNLGDCNCYCG
ncbi:MAG: hypothetical protein KKG59_05500 [Nanoarchaeota archaeon]|nr:hypothetical protein [Nanoarchaeota archaeon]